MKMLSKSLKRESPQCSCAYILTLCHLFLDMVTMTSLRQNVYVALVDKIASHLNGRYVESYEFSILKNGKCIQLDKIDPKPIRKRKSPLF